MNKRGFALVNVLGLMILLMVAGSAYLGSSINRFLLSTRNAEEVVTTHLAEAGIQEVTLNLWAPFKADQNFDLLDAVCLGASDASPKAGVTGTFADGSSFAASVIDYFRPSLDSYSRTVKLRSVGWKDFDGDGIPDADEPTKVIDTTFVYTLARSKVFDYTYFVNNYGWMYGFKPTWLIINGDVRANGDFEFKNGSPTINGSVIASYNGKLEPPADGLINIAPVKWDDAAYMIKTLTDKFAARMRPAYDPAVHGAPGTALFERNREMVFNSNATFEGASPFGAFLYDSTGLRSWERTAVGLSPKYTMLDTQSSTELPMPDLDDLGNYQTLSANYVDTKANFADGTPNPNFGLGAYLEVWDGSTNSYKRVDTGGNVSGSAVLIGTSFRPIRIHGPITATQDIVIKGIVEGQGTLYAGRNIHIIGSVMYKDPPDFRGSNAQVVDERNEKRDMLGFAARGSIMLGNPTAFGNPYPLKYMTPPFTKGRYADDGTYIPPFNAFEVDGTGRMRYQSVIPDTIMKKVADKSVDQIDGIMYTNFLGGGQVGKGGTGFTINGSIISRDEAMVVYSLPMRFNYDNRVKERSHDDAPLIDIQLPRSPQLVRLTWQDRGFHKQR